jgi:L-fuconolactonase
MRIDAHQHYWSTAHTDYGWLQPTPALAPIYRDFGPEDLRPLRAAAGIEGTVLVQAAPSEEETWRLLEIARDPNNAVLGVVGWCDLLAPEAPRRIARLAAEPLLKGLRPMLQDIADPHWMLQPALAPALQAMSVHGLRFDALVKPVHLAPLAEFVRRHPELPIVVDHGAKPAIAARDFDAWARDIAALSHEPRVHCKLSGLATEAAPGWRVEDLRPYVDHLLTVFGPGRLLWGSDWPVLTLAAGYAEWLQACEQLLVALSAAERAQVFGANAARFYGL